MILTANRDALFRLHGLVQAVRPAASRHGSPGVFVDDDDFFFAAIANRHHVVDVEPLQGVGDQGLRNSVVHREHLRVVEILDVQCLFDFVDALFGQRRRMVFLIHPVVTGFFDALARLALCPRLQARDDAIDDRVDLGVFL